MDKYEFKLSLNEINALIGERRFDEAAGIADRIDWNHVRNANTLCRVGEVYRIVGDYDRSRDVMAIAYKREPDNPQIIYVLCDLTIYLYQRDGAQRDLTTSLQLLKEYQAADPENPRRLILQYKIYCVSPVSSEEKIAVLRQLHDEKPTARWDYELAKVYADSGDPDSARAMASSTAASYSGKYADKAEELLSDLGQSEAQEDQENPSAEADADAPDQEEKGPEEEDAQDTAGQQEEQTEQPVPEAETEEETEDRSVSEEVKAAAESPLPDAHREEQTAVPEMEAGEQPSGDSPIEQTQGQTAAEPESETASGAAPETAGESVGHIVTPEEQRGVDSIQSNVADGMKDIFARPYDDKLEQESNGQYTMVVDEPKKDDTQVDGQMSISEVMAEWEKIRNDIRKANDEKRAQRILEDTGSLMQDFDETARHGLLEDIEKGVARQRRQVRSGAYRISDALPERRGADRSAGNDRDDRDPGDGRSSRYEQEDGSYRGGRRARYQKENDQEQDDRRARYPQEDDQEQNGRGTRYQRGETPDRSRRARYQEEESPERSRRAPYREEENLERNHRDGQEPVRGQRGGRSVPVTNEDDDVKIYGRNDGIEAVETRRWNSEEVHRAMARQEELARRQEQENARARRRGQNGSDKSTSAPEEDAYLDEPAEAYDRDGRPAEEYDRDGRPAEEYDRNERPAEEYDRDERPVEEAYDREERQNREDYDRYDRREQPVEEELEEEHAYDRNGRDQQPAEEDSYEEDSLQEDSYRGGPESDGREEEPEGPAAEEELPEHENQEEEPETSRSDEEEPVYEEDQPEEEKTGRRARRRTRPEQDADDEEEEPLSPESEEGEDAGEGAPHGEEDEEISGEVEEAEENAPAAVPAQAEDHQETDDAAKENPAKASGSRHTLTREERRLFGPFCRMKENTDQLLEALDRISLASSTGNLIILGNEATADRVAKGILEIQRHSDSNFTGKIAKVSGDSLNKLDAAGFSKTFAKLENGALIINKASDIAPKTIERLYKELEGKEHGIILIMADGNKRMEQFRKENAAYLGSFTAVINIRPLDDKALVAYAKDYAYSQDYSIDEFGQLALAQRISSMQTSSHRVTLKEVRDLVDEAIHYASRKNPHALMEVISRKRYDENDRIIIHEKDFQHD